MGLKNNINIKNFTYNWFIFSLVLIIIIVLTQGYLEYKRAIKDTILRTSNLTILLTKKLENDFEQVDNLLQLAEYIVTNLPEDTKNLSSISLEQKEIVSNKFKFFINSFNSVSAISFVNNKGDIIISSSNLNSNINISDRPHFKALKDNKELNTAFSGVIFSRITKTNSIVQARAIRDKNGELLGVLTALINIAKINDTLSSINTGKNGVALLRKIDTTLIARYPMPEKDFINKPLPSSSPIYKKILEGEKEGSLLYLSSTDDEKRVGSFLVMDKYPFYVQVAISEDMYLEQWVHNLLIVSVLVAIFIIASCIIFLVMKRSYKKEQLAILELMKNRALFSLGPVIIVEWSFNKNWPIKYISDNCRSVLGYSKNEMKYKNFKYTDLIHPKDVDKVSKDVLHYIENHIDSFEQSYRIKLKDGQYKYFYDYTKLIKDDKNQVIGLVGYIFDQTNLKEKEESLIIERNRLANIITGTNSGTWEWNIETNEVILNNKWAEMIGYTLEELLPTTIKTWIKFVHPDDLKKSNEILQKHFNKEIDYYNCEIRMKHKNGSWIWIKARGKVVSWDENNKPLVIMGIHTDITKDRKLIQEIEIVKNRFENMFKIHSSVMLLIDPYSGEIIDANQSAINFYGYSIDELKGMNVSNINILNPEELKQKHLEAKDLTKNSFIFSHKLKNGDIKTVEVQSSPIETQSGTILFSIIKDVTNERIMQNKLEVSYKNLQRLIEAQANIVILTDGLEIQFANRKFFDFLGFPNLEEFKKEHKCICEFFIENDKFFHLKKIKENENWIQEIKLLEESKRIVLMLGEYSKEFVFSVSVNNFDDNTMIVSFTDISQTVTEKISLEKKILHDKLTNAYNREFFDKNYKSLLNEYHTNESKLAIAMLDIDHFKDVNDTFGHDIGDEVLIQFVDTIHKNSRKNDILVRWGGEEFIMILKLNTPNDLQKILTSLKNSVEKHNFTKVGTKTCSIGGTIYIENEDILKTIKRADEAVYEAKKLGRNKVVIF